MCRLLPGLQANIAAIPGIGQDNRRYNCQIQQLKTAGKLTKTKRAG